MVVCVCVCVCVCLCVYLNPLHCLCHHLALRPQCAAPCSAQSWPDGYGRWTCREQQLLLAALETNYVERVIRSFCRHWGNFVVVIVDRLNSSLSFRSTIYRPVVHRVCAGVCGCVSVSKCSCATGAVFYRNKCG